MRQKEVLMGKDMCGVIEIRLPSNQHEWLVLGDLHDTLPKYYNIYALIEQEGRSGFPPDVSWRTQFYYKLLDDPHEQRKVSLTEPMYLYAEDFQRIASAMEQELQRMKTPNGDHLKFVAAFSLLRTLTQHYGAQHVRMILWYSE